MSKDSQIDSFIKKSFNKTRKEKNIQKDIVDWLEGNLPGEKMIRKIHGSPFQGAGFPDIEMFWLGRAWCFEVKKPGENPTPLQEEIIRKLRRCGTHAWAVRSVEDVRCIMKQHMTPLCSEGIYCNGIDGGASL